jgi:hypothetical protein
MMWQRHWRAGLVAVVLFILGIAAGAATMDMLQEDERTTVTRAATVTTAESTTVRRTRTRTVTAEDENALPAGWSLCTNDARGYSIGYPAGWYTTHLNDEQIRSRSRSSRGRSSRRWLFSPRRRTHP